MNASESKLLAEADRMSESMLVRLEDWELAYLKAAMLHQLEETLSESLQQDQQGPTLSPDREAVIQGCTPVRGYPHSQIAEMSR